jgi:hypothetical protein
LVISALGGETLYTKTRDIYFNKKNSTTMNFLASILNSKLDEYINNSDLSKWKETLAILINFGNEKFNQLCELLGNRLENENKFASIICFICSNNLEKTFEYFSNQLKKDYEKIELSNFIQKIIICQRIKKLNVSESLIDKFAEYARILCEQGLLELSWKYLEMVFEWTSNEVENKELNLLRYRVYNALVNLIMLILE